MKTKFEALSVTTTLGVSLMSQKSINTLRNSAAEVSHAISKWMARVTKQAKIATCSF